MPRVRKPDAGTRRTLRHQLHDAVVAGGLPWSEAVRRMRSALGMTQEQFARAFRITKRQVAELEAGTANPTVATLGRLGRPFGFRVGFIHPGDEAATAGRPDAASDDA